MLDYYYRTNLRKTNCHLMNNLPVDHQGIQLKIKLAIIIEVSKITQKSYTK